MEAATDRVPEMEDAAVRTSWAARWHRPRISAAYRLSTRPAAVSRSSRVERTTSWVPSSSSRAATWALTVGWVR